MYRKQKYCYEDDDDDRLSIPLAIRNEKLSCNSKSSSSVSTLFTFPFSCRSEDKFGLFVCRSGVLDDLGSLELVSIEFDDCRRKMSIMLFDWTASIGFVSLSTKYFSSSDILKSCLDSCSSSLPSSDDVGDWFLLLFAKKIGRSFQKKSLLDDA